MNILILTFSPAGSTLQVSNLLGKKLTDLGHMVQSIDITRNEMIFKQNKPFVYLHQVVKAHDVLCIGSPVYEKHLEFYVERFMKQLPKPNAIWGKIVVPFVTYGGISSGIALKQSLSILTKSGRKMIACMKIESSHIKCAKLQTRVNENMPGDESFPFIDALAKKIDGIKLSEKKQKEIKSNVIDCHGIREKVLCTLMNEQIMHRYKYPQLKIVAEKCSKCLTCVKACSIQRIETVENIPNMNKTLPECIHCFSCVNVCPNDAITFVNEQEGWSSIDRIYALVSKKDSFFRSTENPKSAVYL